MDYTIKHITNERELDDVLAFNSGIFPLDLESAGYSEYTHEKWIERMKSHGDLMLYAESEGKVIGIVFGRIEDSGSLTVGPVAVDERFRKHGIAREMMMLLEKRAIEHDIHGIALGAVESAEEFYEKLGYIGSLLIQSENHSIDELLSLNVKGYKVRYTNIHDGTINQVCLELPSADKELQHKYERELPGCYTQMVFGKTF